VDSRTWLVDMVWRDRRNVWAMEGWSELLVSRGARRAGLTDEAPLLKKIASKWKSERDWWARCGAIGGRCGRGDAGLLKELFVSKDVMRSKGDVGLLGVRFRC